MAITGVAYRNDTGYFPMQNGMANGSKVDPRDASYEEIQAYNKYLVGQGYLKIEDLDDFNCPVKDEKEKADYYSVLQDWADLQYRNGNMAGYHKVAKICEAWINNVEEQDGTGQYLDGQHVWNMSASQHLTSGIIGFGSFEDGMKYCARYADSSTDDNPVVQIRMSNESGTEILVNVDVNSVDPENATELEMFAFLTHLDAQGKSGNDKMMGSYQDLMDRARNSVYGDARAQNSQDFMFQRKDWRNMALAMTEFGSAAERALKDNRPDDGVPYSYLAKDGVINYKGVIFTCDTKRKALCLGNTSDMSKCIRVSLSGGGSLIVNRDNLGDLAKAIGMFSPEDVNLIMRAIAEDAKIQQMKQQIDDETSGLDIAENTGETTETDLLGDIESAGGEQEAQEEKEDTLFK